jgi:hypothetical protein
MFVDDEIQSAGAAGRVADANGDIEQAERHLYLAMIKRAISKPTSGPTRSPPMIFAAAFAFSCQPVSTVRS